MNTNGIDFIGSTAEHIEKEPYHKFHNYIADHLHDKIVRASVTNYMSPTTVGEPVGTGMVLSVTVKNRGYSTDDFFHRQNDIWGSTSDYFDSLRSKDARLWTKLDIEASKAIMTSIKVFDKMSSKAKSGGYSEYYLLGQAIPVDAKLDRQSEEVDSEPTANIAQLTKSSALATQIRDLYKSGMNKEEIKDRLIRTLRAQLVNDEAIFGKSQYAIDTTKNWDVLDTAHQQSKILDRDISRDTLDLKTGVPI